MKEVGVPTEIMQNNGLKEKFILSIYQHCEVI